MNKLLAVGIDVSKATFDVCFLSSDNEIHKIYKNNSKGISELLKYLKPSQQTSSLRIVMESTGRYHFLLALMLSKDSFDVRVINPLIAKRYYSSFIRKVKTDKADARVLAQIALQEKDLARAFSSDKKALQIRQKMGLMASLEKTIQSLKTSLGGYFECQEKLAIETSQAEQNIRDLVFDLTKQVKQLEKEMIDLILAQVTNNDKHKTLRTVPGYSNTVAALIAQFLDSSCEHPKQWIAYIGLDISVRQSGTWRGKGRITKRGNPYLRKRLYQAAWGATMNYPEVRAYYDSLKLSGRNHVEALIIISRKLLRIAFTILKKGTIYDPKCIPSY